MKKRILEVPKVKQLKYHCGPACISMVAAYFRLNLSQSEIAEDIIGAEEIEECGGVHHNDLIKGARNLGFDVREYHNLGFRGLVELIDDGLPIIARIRAKEDSSHFCVIRGYQKNPNTLWINDPSCLSKNKDFYENFAYVWKTPERHIKTNKYGIVLSLK